jgi:uncharacterized protein
MRPRRQQVLDLLRRVGVAPRVISHSLKVESEADRIARRISERGIQVDLELVSIGSLVHDLGRSETHGMDHGIVGARILRDGGFLEHLCNREERERLARICERHIGAGLNESEAEAVGLPRKDYIPQTLEEKIIAHADNLVWNGVLDVEDSRRRFRGRFGDDSPIVRRIVRLGDEVCRLAGEAVEEDHDT